MVPNGEASDKALLTYEDVADRLQMSTETIRKKVAAHEIPFVKIGRLVRFDPADLDAWVEAQKSGEAA